MSQQPNQQQNQHLPPIPPNPNSSPISPVLRRLSGNQILPASLQLSSSSAATAPLMLSPSASRPGSPVAASRSSSSSTNQVSHTHVQQSGSHLAPLDAEKWNERSGTGAEWAETNVGGVDVLSIFLQKIRENAQVSPPVAAIQTLLTLIEHSKATTMSEFMQTLKKASHILKDTTDHPISVSAGCDLFLRYVTIIASHDQGFSTCKEYLLKQGAFLLDKALSQKQKIIQNGQDFIRDHSCVLIHSFSRVVLGLLLSAAKSNRRFRVMVTESRPAGRGHDAAKVLREHGIPTEVILDSAVAYFMDKADMVLVGAEGVVENGGLINAVGTYQLAILAHVHKKPFYAAAESCKFVRMFPLNQYDVPYRAVRMHGSAVSTLNRQSNGSASSAILFSASNEKENSWNKQRNDSISTNQPLMDGIVMAPKVDYTPPQYITLLFTDLGVLTPSGVSDELIQLYY